jgi:hypothetical protein
MINSDLWKQWEQRFSEYETSGKTIKAWCHEQTVRENQFYYWRKKLCMEQVEKGQPVKWLSLELDNRKQSTIAPDSIAVHVGQVTIELQKGFDQHLFREIIQILQTI